MAFEAIVKKQIERLKDPCVQCMNMVVHELNNIVYTISASIMNQFPRLRDETESIVTSYIAEREQICKDQIVKLIDFELAYMNTNHEEFIGFAHVSNDFKAEEKGRNLVLWIDIV